MTYFKYLLHIQMSYNVDNNIITDLELMNSDNFHIKEFLIQKQN